MMKLVYWIRYNFIKILVALVVLSAIATMIIKMLPKSTSDNELRNNPYKTLRKYKAPKGFSKGKSKFKKSNRKINKKAIVNKQRVKKKALTEEEQIHLTLSDLTEKTQKEILKLQRKLSEMEVDIDEVQDLFEKFFKKNKKNDLSEKEIIEFFPEHIKKMFYSKNYADKDKKKEVKKNSEKTKDELTKKQEPKEKDEYLDDPYSEEDMDHKEKEIKKEESKSKTKKAKKENPDESEEDEYKEDEY